MRCVLWLSKVNISQTSKTVASLFRRFWLLLSLVLGASLFRLFWLLSSQNGFGTGSNATGEKLKWSRASIACRWPDFCFVKSQQNQRGAKLAIHGSNSCTTSSLFTAAGFLCQCGSLYLTSRQVRQAPSRLLFTFWWFWGTLNFWISCGCLRLTRVVRFVAFKLLPTTSVRGSTDVVMSYL